MSYRPRIRSLKPEFFRDEKVQRLPRDARLLMIGLIAHADDEGRLDGDPRSVRSTVFPLDDLSTKAIDKLLDTLREQALIHRYEAGGIDWIEIRGWAKHQKINRPTASTIPAFVAVNGSAHAH